MEGSISKSVIKVLLDETFKCEAQSVTRFRGHRLRRRAPHPPQCGSNGQDLSFITPIHASSVLVSRK